MKSAPLAGGARTSVAWSVSMTAARDTSDLLWGAVTGQGQSERLWPDRRERGRSRKQQPTDAQFEMTHRVQATGRLRPTRSQGHGNTPANRRGLFVLCPSLRNSPANSGWITRRRDKR